VNSELGLKFLVVLIALAGIAASTQAIAEDPSTSKQAPVPVAGPRSWSGFYVGGYAGGAFGSDRWTDKGYDDVFYDGGGANSLQRSGITVGGLAGANYQFGRFVIGAEAEYGESKAGSSAETDSGDIPLPHGAKSLYSLTQRFDETGSGRLRARSGYAVRSDLLLYAAGGWTLADTNASLGGYCCGATGGGGGGGPYRPIAPTPFTVSDDRSLNGWNIGVGGEYALTSHWIARLEYVHDGFSGADYSYDYKKIFRDRRDLDVSLNTVRAAMGFKF
jgi:outer membrane immunogenic protein